MSRSTAVAGIVLAVTGILTVWKGGVPVLRYLKFLTVPLAFLFFKYHSHYVQFKTGSHGFFAIPLGNWYLTASYHSFFYAVQLILTALSAVSCLYFFVLYHPNARYSGGFAETALSPSAD